MKKIAFVAPWHGENIPGGAETALRSVTQQLHKAGVDLEILTTCVEKFTADWNVAFYKPGEYVVNGIVTKRFKVKKRNVALFDSVNAKLMKNMPITEDEEKIFFEENVNSPDLYEYMKEHQEEYSFFVFIPYLFGITYYGAKVCPEKTIMIPCAHEESYIHMNAFKEVFEKSNGMIYNAEPEYELVNNLFDMKNVRQCIPGLGMDVELTYDAARFRNKYKLNSPFVIYAGRKDEGKNIYTLLKYFAEYKKRCQSDLKLVLIGGGDVHISEEEKKDVIDLGFVDKQDKYDACAAAICLCQPSLHESFSYVIMESWLCGRPVLVHEKCDVTKNFAIQSKGGLYFDNYFEFEGAINYYIEHQDIALQMGLNGQDYVKENFAWDVVVEKYINFLGVDK